jgi:hypothetical protein
MRHLTLRESPTGDMQRVMWNLSLTRSLKVIKILSLKENKFRIKSYTVSIRFNSAIIGLTELTILS